MFNKISHLAVVAVTVVSSLASANMKVAEVDWPKYCAGVFSSDSAPDLAAIRKKVLENAEEVLTRLPADKQTQFFNSLPPAQKTALNGKPPSQFSQLTPEFLTALSEVSKTHFGAIEREFQTHKAAIETIQQRRQADKKAPLDIALSGYAGCRQAGEKPADARANYVREVMADLERFLPREGELPGLALDRLNGSATLEVTKLFQDLQAIPDIQKDSDFLTIKNFMDNLQAYRSFPQAIADAERNLQGAIWARDTGRRSDPAYIQRVQTTVQELRSNQQLIRRTLPNAMQALRRTIDAAKVTGLLGRLPRYSDDLIAAQPHIDGYCRLVGQSGSLPWVTQTTQKLLSSVRDLSDEGKFTENLDACRTSCAVYPQEVQNRVASTGRTFDPSPWLDVGLDANHLFTQCFGGFGGREVSDYYWHMAFTPGRTNGAVCHDNATAKNRSDCYSSYDAFKARVKTLSPGKRIVVHGAAPVLPGRAAPVVNPPNNNSH